MDIVQQTCLAAASLHDTQSFSLLSNGPYVCWFWQVKCLTKEKEMSPFVY